ncbi:MAG: hypothetical protein CL386_04040 [Acidiferrobacter sp.]|nr:hypothetical protein [Acidiferrobacter sp.]MBO12719.1 hypothetical protein [Planctomycetaceae bacterium]|tara:strand:- start:284 stop:478 length:195 start_codon:yes stop_codon:yes gene_type:complete
MDQALDMQVAALIFLGGTRSLVTSGHAGGVDMTSEDGEVTDDPEPHIPTPGPLSHTRPPTPLTL